MVDHTGVPSPRRLLSSRRALASLIVACVGFGAIPAGAAPAEEAIAPTHEQLEIVAERYNLARLQVERAGALLDRTEARIAAAEARVAVVRSQSRRRIAAMYRRSGTALPFRLDQATAAGDLVRRAHYLDAAEAPDRELVDTLSQQLRTLAAEREAQREARTQLQSTLDEAASMRKRLERMAAQAEAQARARAQEQARAAAAVRASAPVNAPPTTPSRPPASAPSPAPTPTPPSPPPPSETASTRAATAIAFARAQLGKPYAFATSGPDTFDCSGLTMAAWAAAGVKMAHYSGSQANNFPRVGWEQLQPGDIVVFYPDLHHVGLYIGGGMMIHAPQTGDVVKIAPAWRTTFQWGVRPG